MMWATVALLICSAVGAMSVAYISDYILSSFQDTTAMVMLITDAGTKSDDANLERQLSTATLGLKACRDLGWALAVGCLGVGLPTLPPSKRLLGQGRGVKWGSP
jgi:hypothetical protein